MSLRPYASQTADSVIQLARDLPDLVDELGGAALALHQDTLIAFAIDLNRTDDTIWNAMMDHQRPSSLGPFPDRFGMVLQRLPEMDNAWLDFIANGPQNGMSADDFGPLAIMARLRSIAARLWWMTMLAKGGSELGKEVYPSTMTIWKILGIVEATSASERARDYVGTYYSDVKTPDINPGAWRPEEVLSL